ncbi:UNVERIFIED_CONTAM: hypothetical protein PYX00_001514 [Menopon gallinae]|uniref:FLYWCH-type domain-containing protein n=1 Tax=Menopon gallinae TaxID=328185 RepID=A0AAW2IE91_9NEOP
MIPEPPPLCFDYRFSKQKSGRVDSLPRIFHEGFDFVCQRIRKNSFKYWRCTRYINTGCRGRAILECNGGLRLNEGHNHEPLTDEEMLNMYFLTERESLHLIDFFFRK